MNIFGKIHTLHREEKLEKTFFYFGYTQIFVQYRMLLCGFTDFQVLSSNLYTNPFSQPTTRICIKNGHDLKELLKSHKVINNPLTWK